MEIKRIPVIGLRILAVCLLFAVSMVVGERFSGLDRIGQQGPAVENPTSSETASAPQVSPQTAPGRQPAPSDILIGFLTFSLCVGIVVSYLILRSSWRGWTLAGALAVSMYGISTVVSQIESIFFLSNKLPRGLIRALFVEEAIATALFAPVAVLVLGKWRAASPASASLAPRRMHAASAAWKPPLLVVAFVFLYMFFGYYVAWQNPDVRQYYGGPESPTFFAALKGNWLNAPWIYAVASFRALLCIGFVFPLIRMLRVARWESAAATALFLSAWTTILLMPNPLMPASVARSHFWETLEFSLVFGALLGWLLSTPHSAANKGAP
jgi:hypothetical protein